MLEYITSLTTSLEKDIQHRETNLPSCRLLFLLPTRCSQEVHEAQDGHAVPWTCSRSRESALVVKMLVVLRACGLVDGDLHPIGRFHPRIAISPGHLFRVREELRACLLKYPATISASGTESARRTEPLTRLPTSIWSTKAA